MNGILTYLTIQLINNMGLTRQQITDGQGKIRGYIDVGDGTIKGVYSLTKGSLGHYNESMDKTFSNTRGFIGNGDQRLLLLLEH